MCCSLVKIGVFAKLANQVVPVPPFYFSLLLEESRADSGVYFAMPKLKTTWNFLPELLLSLEGCLEKIDRSISKHTQDRKRWRMCVYVAGTAQRM